MASSSGYRLLLRLAKTDSGSYWSFAIVYISIVRRKKAEKALASSAFFSGLWLRE